MRALCRLILHHSRSNSSTIAALRKPLNSPINRLLSNRLFKLQGIITPSNGVGQFYWQQVGQFTWPLTADMTIHQYFELALIIFIELVRVFLIRYLHHLPFQWVRNFTSLLEDVFSGEGHIVKSEKKARMPPCSSTKINTSNWYLLAAS